MLEVKKVTRKFGGLIANNDVSFTVEKGQIVGLIGPNGAGKSTMFNMISSIFPPSSGEIIFEGKRVDQLMSFEVASLGISRTFQNLQIFKNMTVIENTMIGNHSRTKTGMLSAAMRMPSVRKEEQRMHEVAIDQLRFVGMEDLIETIAGSLPLGKLRLLELARALASTPKLLLLDEIAAGLNHRETKELSELIKKIRDNGVTIFLVEHDMDLVMSICDKIIVLDQGEKIAEGSASEIQQNERVIAAYLGVEVEQ